MTDTITLNEYDRQALAIAAAAGDAGCHPLEMRLSNYTARRLADAGLLHQERPYSTSYTITEAGRAAIAPPAVEPGDGLSLAEQAILVEIRDRSQYGRVSIGAGFFAPEQAPLLPGLVDRDYLERNDSGTGYKITAHGRKAVAHIEPSEAPVDEMIAAYLDGSLHQPGDNLPPNDPTDDLGKQLNALVGPTIQQDLATIQQDLVFTINQALGTVETLRLMNERLERQLADERTSNGLLRAMLDDARRNLAVANARLSTRPADDLATLSARIDELAAIVLEPAPFALVEAVSVPVKVEVMTLIQDGINSGGHDDQFLAAKLNEGWQKWHVTAGRDDDGILWRDIILTREVEDDAAGDDPDTSAEIESSDEAQPLPAAIPDTRPVSVDDPAPSFSLNGLETALHAAAEARADGVSILSAMPLMVGPLFVS